MIMWQNNIKERDMDDEENEKKKKHEGSCHILCISGGIALPAFYFFVPGLESQDPCHCTKVHFS